MKIQPKKIKLKQIFFLRIKKGKENREKMEESRNAIIYEIRCNKTGEVYFGSTFKTLAERMSGHKGKHNKCSSKQIIDRGDFSAKILLNCSVPNKTELRKIESMFIRNNECINMMDSFRSAEEKKQDKKKWVEENHEHVKNYARNYIYNEYHFGNRKEYQKNYYHNYHKKFQVINCDCGGRYKNPDRNRHFKTKIHCEFNEKNL